MVERRTDGDFAQAYRPCRISEVVGNDEAKKMITSVFAQNRVPHTILFHGLGGAGKTTLARIIEMGLNCKAGATSEPCCECENCQIIIRRTYPLTAREINAVEMNTKEVENLLNDFSAYGGGFLAPNASVLLISECHRLRRTAAQLCLKHIEDADPNNYFIFCTTKPDKVLKTLRARCTLNIPFEKVSDEEIKKLLIRICECENLQADDQVLDRIIGESAGKPRLAVQDLEKSFNAGDLKRKGNS